MKGARLHYQTFQLNIFNKLNVQMVFDNKETQILQKIFLMHIILFERIHAPPKNGD